MATNPYVNKVIYGDDTVMDISDTTANEGDVAEGEIFYKGSGQRATGTGRYYSPNDSEGTVIDDSDYIPFYDASATSKKNALWSTIKTKIKDFLEPIYTKLVADTVGWTGKNLLPLNTEDEIVSGVTFTFHKDAKGLVDYIELSGTATENIEYTVGQLTSVSGSFIANGGLSSFSDNDCCLKVSVSGSTSYTEIINTTDKALTIGTSMYSGSATVKIFVASGYNTDNTKFYPMIRRATESDPTFEPYHGTVEDELTDKYDVNDTAETTIADDDYFPFYDTSATGKRNSLWSNIKAKLKAYFDGIYALRTMIGTVETGSTASKAYIIGEHFVKDGYYCTAKTAISSGATFSLNTNYTRSNIANTYKNIDASWSQDVTYTGTTGVSYTLPITIYKIGPIKILVVTLTYYPSNQNTILAKSAIPAAFRPASNTLGVGASQNDAFRNFQVTTDGRFIAYKTSDTTGGVFGSMTYI